MIECVLDNPLTCFRKDKNCEKPVTELIPDNVAAKLRNDFYAISEKIPDEK